MKHILNEKDLSLVCAFVALLIHITISLRILNYDNFINYVENTSVLFGWVVVAIILGFVLGMRPALWAGASIAFSIVAIVFCYWTRHDAMGWLIYLFCLPGGFIAYLILAFKARNLPSKKAFVVSLLSILSATYVNYVIFDYVM